LSTSADEVVTDGSHSLIEQMFYYCCHCSIVLTVCQVIFPRFLGITPSVICVNLVLDRQGALIQLCVRVVSGLSSMMVQGFSTTWGTVIVGVGVITVGVTGGTVGVGSGVGSGGTSGVSAQG
jgi:hypothetical protein